MTFSVKNDPSMLGQTNYPRAALDHYPTPARATQAFVNISRDWIGDSVVWEPACGNGAITKVVSPVVKGFVSTDIKAYEGFTPDALEDFLGTDDYETVAARLGSRPDGIITNPPYGKEAEMFARRAIELMEPVKGWVAFLCRHEWDAAKGRAPLFDHPAFSGKITLRFRPRWIEGTTGAPRFPYAWYCWNWQKDASQSPVMLFAE